MMRRSRVTGKWKYYVANPAYGKHTFDEEGMARYWLNGTKGVVIAIEPTEQFDKIPEVKQKHSLLRFARKYVWPFKLEMSQSAVGMLLGILLSLVTPS